MPDEEVETLSLPFSKAQAGIKLKAGHKTVLVIEDKEPDQKPKDEDAPEDDRK